MTPTEVMEAIVKLLFDEGANDWSIQDKAALLATVNLQLQEGEEEPA